jgi:hypothetical protein
VIFSARSDDEEIEAGEGEAEIQFGSPGGGCSASAVAVIRCIDGVGLFVPSTMAMDHPS